VAETFQRRKKGEEWALEMERNIDRNGSAKPRAARNVRTFGDPIDLHDEDLHEVESPRQCEALHAQSGASARAHIGPVSLRRGGRAANAS
jgi:hypothetical protein